MLMTAMGERKEEEPIFIIHDSVRGLEIAQETLKEDSCNSARVSGPTRPVFFGPKKEEKLLLADSATQNNLAFWALSRRARFGRDLDEVARDHLYSKRLATRQLLVLYIRTHIFRELLLICFVYYNFPSITCYALQRSLFFKKVVLDTIINTCIQNTISHSLRCHRLWASADKIKDEL